MVNLIKTDIRDALNQIQKNSIDLVVTSPPYNVGIDYDTWDDTLSWEDYYKFTVEWLFVIKELLKDDGRFCINVQFDVKRKGEKNRTSLWKVHVDALNEVGLNYGATVLLKEPRAHRSNNRVFGSWLSASSPFIMSSYEVCIVGYKKQWKKNSKGESTIEKKEFIEYVTGEWPYFAETRKLTKANFSLFIPDAAIKLLTYKGDTVLDPFCGSGTTGVAAFHLGRKFIGVDISEEYLKIAQQRILNHEKEYERYLSIRKKMFGF